MTESSSQNKTPIYLYSQAEGLGNSRGEDALADEMMSQVWQEFAGQLKKFIAGRVRDQGDVEDILQDVFLKIHRSISQLKNRDKLSTWVFQITRNAITDYYRYNQKSPAAETADLESFIQEVSPHDVQAEVATWLPPMIEQLPEKYREALRLTDIEGLTQQQLADRLNLSLSGAKSRVQRAREKLKDRLLQCCHLEFDRLGRVIEYQLQGDHCRYCGTDAPAG